MGPEAEGFQPFTLVVAGTPGVGKSTFARLLAAELNCGVIEPSSIALERSLGVPDPERPDTLIIDEVRLVEAVKEGIRGPCSVIATHYPSLFLEDDEIYHGTAAVALLRANPLMLASRLEARGWGRRKVLENVMAEALGAIAGELVGYEDMVFEVDTSGTDVEGSLRVFFDKLESWDVGIRIDWLALDEVSDAVVAWGSELDSYEGRSGG